MSRCDPDPPMFEAVLHNSTCIHNTEMYLLYILICLSFRPETKMQSHSDFMEKTLLKVGIKKIKSHKKLVIQFGILRL